jgi:glycosyltransferase involved in cell wall biosynthesis
VPKLSVTVITLNEAAHIEACLRSVAWADEILVVDSGSTDGTADLARAAGARVIVRGWPGYSEQKNFAAAQVRHDWILSVDADERIPSELAGEIRGVLTTEPAVAGYRIPRKTWHLGRWIRGTDWFPDPQLRLYDRRRACWLPKRVHESVDAKGPVGRLSHAMEHYAYRNVSHHVETMNKYTTLAAEEMAASGREAGMVDLVVHPAAAFVRNYVLKMGFRDGLAGLIVSVMNTFYVFLKFAKLWALKHPPSEPPDRR